MQELYFGNVVGMLTYQAKSSILLKLNTRDLHFEERHFSEKKKRSQEQINADKFKPILWYTIDNQNNKIVHYPVQFHYRARSPFSDFSAEDD